MSREKGKAEETREWREVTLPPRLFSSATSVRLSGCMTRDFVHCVLGDPSKPNAHLKSLELDNLMKWSDFSTSVPEFPHLKDLARYVADHDIRSKKGDCFMIGVLDPYIGVFSALESLRITTWGSYEEFRRNPLHEQMYQSWSNFLDSVRTTLKSFSFEQGTNRNHYEFPRAYCRGRIRSGHRPMDRLFRTKLLPCLSTPPWPKLKRLELRGMGRSVCEDIFEECPSQARLMERSGPDAEHCIEYHPENKRYPYTVQTTYITITQAMEERLREVLGEDAEILIEEEAKMDYESPSYGDLGVPDLGEELLEDQY